MHKREVIKSVVESNLNQAITSYSRNSSNGDYKLPKLTETDWDQILRNVSIITFIQNIPIGMKYYNNYAIATSTMNKEYVDPEEIYLNATGDEYYHMPYCKHLEEIKNMIGYRSIDYVQKSYTQKNETGEYETKYYYKHSNNVTINVNQACYYCLVQKSLYEKDETDEKSTAYNTALARERYVARMTKLPSKIKPSYYIYVEAVDSDERNIVAGFFIRKPDGTTVDHTGDKAVLNVTQKITEDDKDKSYYIEARNDPLEVNVEADIPTEETGSLNEPRDTNTQELVSRSPYESESKLNVEIDEYNNEGIKVYYNDYNTDVDYGNGDIKDYSKKDGRVSCELGIGYVNVKLKYEANYKNPIDAQPIEVWANINNYNNLTIVTNLKDITGKVRLKFTNGAKTYYSKETFDIKNKNTNIYCKISDDTAWYEDEWNVEVLKVDNKSIGQNGSGKVKYYTIKDATGLKGFAKATNEGAKTNLNNKPREFRLIDNINMENDEITPICISDGEGNNWFDGIFKGQGYTISNIKIEKDNNLNHAFGLFGFIGAPGQVDNLVIDTINIYENGEEIKSLWTGGLAGRANKGTGQNEKEESIKNVTVKNLNIDGTTKYVGGIVGESIKKLDECNVYTANVERHKCRRNCRKSY